ncbi:hypothetical protein V1264_010638 [Littorina saxatilis]|uniref:Ig-like domain-containing protein n=1 Tax=Littorina saxatilis TaxID=31220 RepID=A0AAN9AQ11_9CAEN
MTLSNVSCEDAGWYTCQAVSGGNSDQSSALITLTAPAVQPTLAIDPYLVEGQYSAHNPTCTTESLGYNPQHVFNWVVKRDNVSDPEQLPPIRQTHTIQTSNSTCESSGKSVLDPDKYWGLHESRLCCQLVTNDTQRTVVQEACTETLMVVPGNFCRELDYTNDTSSQSKLVQFPFEPNCFPYVNCDPNNRDRVSISSCGEANGFCFNEAAQSCSTPRNTSGPEWVCGSVEYIPQRDTYPDRCKDYQRCVHGTAFPNSCQGNEVFSQVNSPCAVPSNTTYCRQRQLNEPATSPGTGPTGIFEQHIRSFFL